MILSLQDSSSTVTDLLGVDPSGGWLLPLALLGAGIGLGLLVEGWFFAHLRSAADRTEWGWDDVVMDALRGMAFVWFAAGGLYTARQVLPVELPDLWSQVVDKGIIVVVGLSFTVVAARLTTSGLEAWARSTEGVLPSITLLENVARILVFVLGVFLILQNLGVKVGALVASLGIGGLAVALALQDTLSNLFAGFQIILAGQVRNGDYVRLDTGEEGYVTDIRWRNTTIKSRVEDHEVVVPNAKLANAIVTNFDLPSRPLWVRLEVGVSYASDLERVEEVTLEVARSVMEDFDLGGESWPDPILRYRSFGDSAVTFLLRVRIDRYDTQFGVRHELIKKIHARYREEGIEIPFPIRTLYAPDGLAARKREAREGTPEAREEGRGAKEEVGREEEQEA